MKPNFFVTKFNISLSIIIIILAFSCKRDEPETSGTGQLKISFAIETNNSLKSARVDEVLSSIVISIDRSNGTHLITSQKIFLQKFNNVYITEPIALEAGDYKLTYFAVLDASDQIKYLTPIAGSPLAALVSHPLSIDFTIEADQVCTLIPEVLSTASTAPADFGLTEFKFLIFKPVQIFVYSYDSATENYKLSTGSLTVSNGTLDIITTVLQAKSNIISLPLNQEQYIFKISKPEFKTYVDTFKIAEIEALNSPLLINLEPDLGYGLVAYYPLDGNAKDLSGNGYDGIIQGVSFSTDRFGKANSACLFGENKYIQLGSAFDLKEKTISLWFNCSQFLENQDLDVNSIYTSDNPNLLYGENTLSIRRIDGIVKLYYSVNCATLDQHTSYSTSFQYNQWYNLCISVNASTIKYYLDGLLLYSTPNDLNLKSVNGINAALVGASRTGLSRYFNGKVDNIRIYNRVLTDTEIELLYNE